MSKRPWHPAFLTLARLMDITHAYTSMKHPSLAVACHFFRWCEPLFAFSVPVWRKASSNDLPRVTHVPIKKGFVANILVRPFFTGLGLSR